MSGLAHGMHPDAHGLPERAPLTDVDTTERLGTDDLATQCAEQLLSARLLAHKRAAAAAQASEAGVCTNCGEACLPRAVYCDADCREDHEERVQTLAKQGRRW